jgi:hypothetical protein
VPHLGPPHPAADEEDSAASRALRRFTLGSGPLKRTSDRLQFLARVLLACSLVTTIPVALVVASVTRAQALTEATAQALARHQVDAELVADPTVTSRGADDVPPTSRAPATWSGPSGEEHTGALVVPAGAEAGSTVPIWVDRDGELTTRPLDGGDAVGRSVAMAAGTFLCLSSLAAGIYLAFGASLERSRLRRWAAGWAVIEPQWTRRVP